MLVRKRDLSQFLKMMCFDGHVLPSKAQCIFCSAHLRGSLSHDQVITVCLYFLSPDLS